MTILLNPDRDPDRWMAAFSRELPAMTIELGATAADPTSVEFVVATRHDPSDLARYPNLRAVLAMGAGIEQYLGDAMPNVPIVRLADPAMADEMAAFVVHWVVHFQKRIDVYLEQQTAAQWQSQPYSTADAFPVGILGFGEIGRRIGGALLGLGFPINAWSRTGTDLEWANSFAGADELDGCLAASDAVINVLPDSPATRGLLNSDRFDHFRRGALLVNLGRGATTNEADLIVALDDGRVGTAVLDVADPEPMNGANPLWRHPAVRVTPHVAGVTRIPSAAGLIAANIRRILAGAAPFPLVDKARGY